MLVDTIAGDRGPQPQAALGTVIQLHELGDLLEVDDQVGVAEPLAQLDDQVGATRQHPRRARSFLQKCRGLGQGRRGRVIEVVHKMPSHDGSTRLMPTEKKYTRGTGRVQGGSGPTREPDPESPRPDGCKLGLFPGSKIPK